MQWNTVAHDEMVHTIVDILKRPIMIDNGDFPFTGVKSWECPQVLLDKSQNVRQKLDYFEFFRADITFRLVFNATPFQQGRYWLFFSPFEGVTSRDVTGSLQNATGYPGIEIDLANGAPVEMTVPYCSPLSHFRLTNGSGDMGQLKMQSIQPLTSGSTEKASYQLFAWFTNIELAMPASEPIFTAQMKTEEEQANSRGLISAPATVIANVADAVGSVAPMLSEITVPVAWVARAVSKVASFFGFNKPTNLIATNPMALLPGKGYTNMDGLDLSTKLAAAPDNSIVQYPGLFSTDCDEMSLDCVKKKSCIVMNAGSVTPSMDWKVGDPMGKKLLTIYNTPCATEQITEKVDATTLNYLASIFRYWRGGIKYRLTVTKTAFHTGRLRISFVPAGCPEIATDDVLENVYNWVLDLSQSSEIEFTVPYVSNRPWTLNRFVSPGEKSQLDYYYTGYLIVTILTPLRAASNSVAQKCPLTLWHSGAEDMEFAVPEFALAFPYDASKSRTERLKEDEFVAQIFNATSDAISHNEQEKNTSVKMFPATDMDFLDAEKLTTGEKITSLRQLIKRFGNLAVSYDPVVTNSSIVYGPGNPTGNLKNFALNSVGVDPCYFGERTINGEKQLLSPFPTKIASGSVTESNFLPFARTSPSQVPLHYISHLYRFYRGGKRYKMIHGETLHVEENNFGTITMRRDADKRILMVRRYSSLTVDGEISPPALLNAAAALTPTFEHTQFDPQNPMVEVEVPYYSTNPISVVGERRIRETPAKRLNAYNIRGEIAFIKGLYPDEALIPSPTSGADGLKAGQAYLKPFGTFRLMEAAADDFSFGYLIGAPPIAIFA